MKSLRLRLVTTLCVAICVLWSSVAAWMFNSLRHELVQVLDERLVASTRMVAGIMGQFPHAQIQALTKSGQQQDLTSVVGRDGVACEVSLVRSEVEVLPVARTENSPGFDATQLQGFGNFIKGGKAWRTYVLEENGLRITTADSMDVRTHLVQSFAYALILPFLLVLMGSLALTWWLCTLGLEPLRNLQRALAQRPPQDSTPIRHGQDMEELAPMVNSLNDLLARMNATLEHERRWTADAAHELRTPLTAIKTHVQIAQLLMARSNEPQSQKVAQAIDNTLAGIGRMHEVMEQLLLLARIEGQEAYKGGQVQGAQLLQLLKRTCDKSLVSAKLKNPQAQLRLQMQPSNAADWQDAAVGLPEPLLACAIGNLLDNAFQHNPAHESVQAELLLDTAAATLCISITNQGTRLSAQECELALQRFWRKNPSTPGSGLGLTIVQRIVAFAGGQLVLRSPEEGGVVAQIHLPLSKRCGSA